MGARVTVRVVPNMEVLPCLQIVIMHEIGSARAGNKQGRACKGKGKADHICIPYPSPGPVFALPLLVPSARATDFVHNLRGARHNSARVRRRLLQMYNSATIATTRMQFAALQSHHGV